MDRDHRKRRVWVAAFLSVLSGLLLTAGFPKVGLPYFTWVALVPLFIALRGTEGKEAFRLGYVCGLVHYVSTLYWIQYVVGHYGNLPAPVALAVLLLLCGYLALYPALFALLSRQWAPCPLLWIWGLPAAWVTLEWIRAHALTGFPWANLGYTQTPFASLIQIADVTGVWGVSWLLVFANTCLMALLSRLFGREKVLGWTTGDGGTSFLEGRSAKYEMISILILICCVGGVLFYGGRRLEDIRSLQKKVSPWAVGVVQGNIDQSLKWSPEYRQETLDRYRQLSLRAARHSPSPQLLVWPETAAPFFYGIEEEWTKQLREIVSESDVALLFGSPGVEEVNGEPRLLNKAYLMNEETSLLGQYAKQHLVPFGEYVPLKTVLFFVHRMVEAAGDFAAGRSSAPLRVDGQGLGVLICYEAIFPDLARRTVNQGADILVNITNDAWFGTTSAPYQHFDTARWRAIEFRVPLIRSANTGISTIFDAAGQPCERIPLNEAGFLVCDVRPLRLRTVYATWGDWFAWIGILITLGGLVYSARNHLTRRTM